MALRGRAAFAVLVLAAGVAAVVGADGAAAPQRRPTPEFRGGQVPRLAAGRLLVATPALRGPFFQQTVVLLLEVSLDSGALGVVVNKPTDVALAEVLPEEASLRGGAHRAWLGGPVGRDRITVLFRASGAPPVAAGESQSVVDGVRVGGSPAVLRALAEAGQGPDRWRAYVGYAGWAPGQLEGELLGGSWSVADGAARWIFAADASAVWPELIERSQGLRTRRPGERVAAGLQRWATMYAIQAGSSGACSRRVKMPLPSSLLLSVPSQ